MKQPGMLFVWGALAVAVGALFASPASAADDPNPGALTLTASFDVPSLYYFRGIRQETDPKLTLWPAADLGIALASGGGRLKRAGVNIGVWNSLHTGTSGTGGATKLLHYEEDFYAALNLGFGGGVGVATQFTAITSPNRFFSTIEEVSFKVTKAGGLAPYGFITFELSDDGQADLGSKKGTYLELGAGPSMPLGGGKYTLTIPVKVGLSVSNYYELAGKDKKFGFFDIGGLLTVPLTAVPSRFGVWNVHGGADFLRFGDATEAFNVNEDGETKRRAITWTFGLGFTY